MATGEWNKTWTISYHSVNGNKEAWLLWYANN
jgi:hypothetical protein